MFQKKLIFQQSNNDDWKEMEDKTGQKYYWNTKTNQTAWKIPAKVNLISLGIFIFIQ